MYMVKMGVLTKEFLMVAQTVIGKDQILIPNHLKTRMKTNQ